MKIAFHVHVEMAPDGAAHLVAGQAEAAQVLAQYADGRDFPALLIPQPDGSWRLELKLPAPQPPARD